MTKPKSSIETTNDMARITSILEAPCLGKSVTGIEAFKPDQIEFRNPPRFLLPSNLRLGHIAEKTVIELIRTSKKYEILYENVQVTSTDRTLGELDLIVRESKTDRLTHLEIAYKFYLLDPKLSHDPMKQWIGPNRNDTLYQKLKKLKEQQFPLLRRPETRKILGQEVVEHCNQKLCFMASLYVPMDSRAEIASNLVHAIKGYYISNTAFSAFNHLDARYYIPNKTKWGIDPSHGKNWSRYDEIKVTLEKRMNDGQSLLLWRKVGSSYSSLFVVWW